MKNNLLVFIRNNFAEIMVFLCVLFGIYSLYNMGSQKNVTVQIENHGPKANYSPDIEFLDCISIQHSCIYSNVEAGNSEFIIENCKGEDFCGKPVVIQGSKRK